MTLEGKYPDFYPNIPGAITEIKDGPKNQKRLNKSGKKVVIVGTATDGPVLEPVDVNSYEEAEEIFGTYHESNTFNGATLMRDLKRAVQQGADNLTLLRISGEHASATLPLYQEEKIKTHQAREYGGKYPGNIEQDFDLGISVAPEYDDVHVTDVVVYGDGQLLTSQKYNLNSSGGIVTLFEDAINSESDVTVNYSLVDVAIESIIDEVADCTNPSNGLEFKLDNENVVDNASFAVTFAGTTEDPTYSVDYKAGLIVLDTAIDVEGGATVTVTYDYKREDVTEGQSFTGVATGTAFYVTLAHTADPTKEMVVSISGTEVDEDDISISYQETDTSTVFIATGSGDLNDDVYISYYWTEEELISPEVNVESIFGGDVYNKVKFEIEDELFTTTTGVTQTRDYLATPEAMVQDGTDTNKYYFPNNDKNIVADTEVIIDDVTTLVAGTDYTLNATEGSITLTGHTVTTTLETEGYDYLEYQETYTSIVEGEDLAILEPLKVRAKKEYIVPGTELITVNNSGGEVTLAEGEYTIDYAKGLIELDSAYKLAAGDSVAMDYEHYNLKAKRIKMFKPEEKVSEGSTNPIIVEVGPEINTIGELISEINNHNSNNVVRLSIPEEYYGLSALQIETPDTKLDAEDKLLSNEVSLEFGQNGVNITKEEAYTLLEGETDNAGNKIKPGAFDILIEDEDVEIVLLSGLYADDMLLSEYKNFAQKFADFLARAFFRNNEIRGIMGVKPLKNPTRINIINRVQNLLELDTNYFLRDENHNVMLDNEGNRVDVGKYLSIVGHDMAFNDINIANVSIENGASSYAGLVSVLAEDNSPTNTAFKAGSLAYKYSNNQANKLIGNKLVTFRRGSGETRVTNGIVCSQPDSHWTKYHTTDIVFDVVSDLRKVYNRYIGQSNSLEKRNSLDSDIRRTLKNKGTVLDFDYNLVQKPSDDIMSRMIVELEIIPVSEIHKIKTVVSVNANM